MGSWNGTCAISNLHIYSGQRVAVFMLLKNNREGSFCYSNALYTPCPIPFYGEYNDYGSVEECQGFGLNIVIDALRSQLYKFGQGPNSSHDIEVNKDNFDIDKLFEADHEDRLGIENHNTWNTDDYQFRALDRKKEADGLSDSENFELDRLANKIKKVDAFQRVTHVIVHGDIFDNIMQNWYIKEYVGTGKGDSGHANSYTRKYFKNIVDTIPEYVDRLKQRAEELKAARDNPNISAVSMIGLFGDPFSWDDACLAGAWMSSFGRGSGDTFGLIDVPEYVAKYSSTGNWEGLANFAKEALTTMWINSFMSYTRKIWTKQCGAGSQNTEHLGYQILAESTLSVLKAEQAKYGMDDEDDYEEEDDESSESVETTET